MYERIGIAVTESKFAFEIVTDLAMFGQSAFPDDGGQFIQRLACFLLNIVKLGLPGFIERTHQIISLANRIVTI
jgi:hypothetical protein